VYYRNPGLFYTHSGYAEWLTGAIKAFLASHDPAALRPLWDHFLPAVLAYDLVPSADYNYRPQRALLALLPAALNFGAMAVCCLRLGDWRHRMLALWFWGATIALSMLSPAPPTFHRALPVLASCALMIGLAWDRVVASWEAIGGLARRAALPIA